MYVSLFIFNEDWVNMHFWNSRQMMDLMSYFAFLNQKTFCWIGGDNL